jgi:DNA-nicking Smr family endonuclease
VSDPKGPPVPESELALFRAAVADVRPIERGARITRPEPKPRARFRRADEAQVLAESLAPGSPGAALDPGEAESYRRRDVAPATLKRLARGEFAVQAVLDLHGLRRADARLALAEFLAESAALRIGCVRVIHGKGHRSGPHGPVLKPAVERWLREHAMVAAFVSARAVDGGSGALSVLLAP